MSQALTGLDEPIVAIACQDREGAFHFYYCDTPIQLKHIDFQDDLMRINNLCIAFHWFNSIVICTRETLEELKRKLANA